MKKSNRLIKEKSPYLLQHAYNPVDWFPWSEEAFKKAKQEEKPVFLSIGYSTCHWCHVMEKESFEDVNVATLMNESFISIKVDKEERPDIDGVYMTVCQMLTGSGGWPLTIIMTPEKKPFFAGTYFPKEDRFGKMGMLNLLPRISDIWKTRRTEIDNSADEITFTLKGNLSPSPGEELNEEIMDKAFKSFENVFDPENGGFGDAPKFPTPHNLQFLLRYWKRKNSSKALEIVETTLTEMYKGGIQDHIGFGFHRYSTDRFWLVPHFEKMLYDQALLAITYDETFQAVQKDLYKNAASEILEYVSRELISDEGGFYSAEDADSEGEEGKFYLWTKNEIENILNPEDAEFFFSIFEVKDEGNWTDHLHDGNTGTNILHIKKDIDYLLLQDKGTEHKLRGIKKILFDYREKRIHPFKDTKILTDWNGLMISAFAKAAQVFGIKQYYSIAEKAVQFVLKNLFNEEGRLMHRFRDGESGISAYADDYSFFIAGLLDTYESGFNPGYLKTAIELNNDFIKYFWDEKDGSFFFTASDSENLLFRQKEIYDGAAPSANSVAILNLLRIARMTGNTEYEKKAEKILKTFSKMIYSSPHAFTQTLIALDFILGPSKEIVIAGNKESSLTKEMISIVNEKFLPNKVTIFSPREETEIESIVPFIKQFKVKDNKTLVYICENYICKLPADTTEKLRKLLDSP